MSRFRIVDIDPEHLLIGLALHGVPSTIARFYFGFVSGVLQSLAWLAN